MIWFLFFWRYTLNYLFTTFLSLPILDELGLTKVLENSLMISILLTILIDHSTM